MVIVRLYETQHYSTEQDKFSKQAEIQIRNLSVKDKTVFNMLCNSHARFKMLKFQDGRQQEINFLPFALVYTRSLEILLTLSLFSKRK